MKHERKLSVELAETILKRYPDPDQYPYRSWSYSQGFMLWGFIRLWDKTGDKRYFDYVMRYAGEHVVCKDIFSQLCKDEAVAFTPSIIGSYWNGNSTIEIDVVAIDNTRHRIFAAECKYLKNKPVDFAVYASLLQKCKTLDFAGYDIIYGLFSRSGFDKRLMDLAKKNDNLVLINEWTICT